MSEPEGRAGLTDKLDADVRAALGRIDDPTRAEPLPEAVAAIRALATLPQTTVAVVSGRALRELATLSRLPSEVHLARQPRLRVRPWLHPAARAGDDRVAPPAVRGSGDDLERPSGRAAGGEAGECRCPYARGERAVAERVLEAVRCGPACGVRKLDPGHPVPDLQVKSSLCTPQGFFFVPPYDDQGLAAAVFSAQRERQRPTGRLVVHKRVVDENDPSRRFERRGFSFEILDVQGQPVANSQFVTDSTGRGICPVELTIGQTYALQELASPVQNVQLQNMPFTMKKRNQPLHVVNQVMQPNTPYGG